MRFLPPVAALVAFDLAVRHLSFQKAAEELCITPSAVSHRIKALEQFIGVRLFHRLNRRLILSDAGALYAKTVRDALERIEKSTRRLMEEGMTTSLNVQLPPSLATKWLLPNLPRFLETHPDFEVKVNATEGSVAFGRSPVDIIVCHFPPDGAFHVEELIAEQFLPLCAPSKWIATPADLVRFPLIKTERNPVGWEEWLQHNEMDYIDLRGGLQFDPSSVAIQAAAAGLGIILESDILTREERRNGQLICPFNQREIRPIVRHYFLVYPTSIAEHPKVEIFVSWLRSLARDRSDDQNELGTVSGAY